MGPLSGLVSRISREIDDVAERVLRLAETLRRKRKIQIVEGENETFEVRFGPRRSASMAPARTVRYVEGRFVDEPEATAYREWAGADVEMVLASRRFMFRSLELPAQASEFLDAIVRAQIDRLTPWSPAQAAFGRSSPAPISGGRVGVTVAATAQSALLPMVAAMEARSADRVVASVAEEGARGRIVVFERHASRARGMTRLRRWLIAAPAVAGGLAAAASVASAYFESDLEAARAEVSKRLAERRAALSTGPEGGAAGELARKKRNSPASVIVLESLSRALPDDASLSELEISEGKLRISGVARRAATLIGALEQSSTFKHAAFFAPSTRAAADGGEMFHLEAELVPDFAGAR